MAKRKRGRNDPCWCGSKKKYKFCHLGRENQKRLKPYDITAKFNKAFSAKMCLAPKKWQSECRGGICKAHTVSRSGSLNRIARDGRVYSIVRPLHLKELEAGVFEPVLRGIKQASTFTGFCAKHDNGIFEPLDNQTFTGTPEQCCLIGYRAIAREYYTKMSATQFIPVLKEGDKGRGPSGQQEYQSFIQAYERETDAGFRDLRRYKAIYDSILERQQFGTIRGYVIEFADPPPVMCSGAIFPEQDFAGVELQDLGDLSLMLDQLSFSSFYGGEHGVVVFSWLAEHERACRAFVRSLMAIPNNAIAKPLLRFFFTHCENIHLAPEWWEGQTAQSKQALIGRKNLFQGLTPAPLKEVLPGDAELHAPLTVVDRYELVK